MFTKSIATAIIFAASAAQADIGGSKINMFDGSSIVLASGGHERVYNRPPSSFKGQWFTTPDGCSYSRANPPGGRPSWHLILNPHHIGQPSAHRGCAAML